MNMHGHMSGQSSGQMPNSSGNQLPVQSQQGAGISMPPLMQRIGTSGAIADQLELGRRIVRERITQLIQRHPHATEWLHRLSDVVKKVDDWMYKNASSKEEYMNMDTLEHRLHSVIKSLHGSAQPLAHHVSYSATISTMIPTPGMSQSGTMNPSIISPVDSSVAATTSGAMRQSTASAGGTISSGYQQPSASVPLIQGNTNMMPSIGLSHKPSQMIPTPGLNNQQSTPMVSGGGNVGYGGLESTIVSQQLIQKQYTGPQNNRMPHNVGAQLGSNMRSNMQLKYDFSNGGINGGLGGNNMLLMDGSAPSDSYISASSFSNASNGIQQQADQLLQQNPTSLSQQVVPTGGDGYGMTDIAPNGSLYASVVPSGSMMSQNTAMIQSRLKANVSLAAHQANLQSTRHPAYKTSNNDGSNKMDFQTHSSRDNLMQNPLPISKYQLQQFQQQLNTQFVQHPYLQKKHNESHPRVTMQNDAFRQPLLASDVSSLIHDLEAGSQNRPLVTQVPEQFHPPELHSQYEQNATVDAHMKDVKPTGEISTSQSFYPFSRGLEKIQQIYLPNESAAEIQNELISTGVQSETILQGHWHPQPIQSQLLNQPLHERCIQNEMQQRIIGQDEAQLPQFLVEDSVSPSVNGTKGVSLSQLSIMPLNVSENPLREQQYYNQCRWLLFLRHARWCSAPKGKCQEVNCITVQQLWVHMHRCDKDQCGYPRCRKSKVLIGHYRNCKTRDCPVCIPVHEYIASKRKPSVRPLTDSDFAVNDPEKNAKTLDSDKSVSRSVLTSAKNPEDLQSSLKRLKVEHSSVLVSKGGSSLVSIPPTIQPQVLKDSQIQGSQAVETYGPSNFEAIDMKMESSLSCGGENPFNLIRTTADNSDYMVVDVKPVPSTLDCITKQEAAKVEKQFEQVKVELKHDVAFPAESVSGGKLGKPKIKGVSMTELFTPEQVREHIISLKQWVGQSKSKAEKNQAMEHSISENSCQLCAVEKLTFEPPPIYCTTCGARIKRNAMYYTAGNSETRHYFCIACYNEVRSDSIEVEGSFIPKAKLEKKKNDEEIEEWWVQCDKCEAWQHQICALFNGRRNDGGQAEYTCPNCYIQEIERGERKPLPQNAVLGAKDLPRTLLSDHIEQRLFKRLKHERQERARLFGKTFDDIPSAEALVVRVVSSVDKKLEVKPRFLEIFQEENYVTEFPYKSKVVLLFQKIEGVEVCLFGMYVQEFGSECSIPNQRRVYLSYLDSVKYFRPETKTVSGEALRTFVYHEILIGYLEYCKKRGFTSCYIWACPPLKGEDYILYCHPEIQKTPKSDKLREWYLAMLRKASKENIVVDVTNLYDHFFVNVGESKAKITAARLPYFDGDYWPGAAEDMINQLQQEEDGRKQQKKGKTKKTLTKRALKAAGHTDLSGNISKDTLLMQKLGETICPIKEDFIMVHLQHACTHCCLLMVDGIRWVCNQCKSFQLCEMCYDLEQKREERERHPSNARDKHFLNLVEINDVPPDTKDKDEILESEFFDTRQAFLSLCQGNHYQYDTLRRAKHSSMMVLYHLHNPTAPAFVTTCNVCQHDIETGQGWRCETCPDFDVCNSCYQKDGGVNHPHKLTNNPSTADAQNTEARQKRVLQLRKMLDLLVHASQCRSPQCQYPNCRKVKGLFRHGIVCKTRASGGCPLCKKMWYLLQLHARACKESDCHVPRCRDLKEHLRRLQQQSDSRRRAAVMEMMRQRAAEVAGNAG